MTMINTLVEVMMGLDPVGCRRMLSVGPRVVTRRYERRRLGARHVGGFGTCVREMRSFRAVVRLRSYRQHAVVSARISGRNLAHVC